MAECRKFARHRDCQKRDHTNGVANAKYKELSANDVGHQYNFQHIVLVTKYRYKMFKNPRTVGII